MRCSDRPFFVGFIVSFSHEHHVFASTRLALGVKVQFVCFSMLIIYCYNAVVTTLLLLLIKIYGHSVTLMRSLKAPANIFLILLRQPDQFLIHLKLPLSLALHSLFYPCSHCL